MRDYRTGRFTSSKVHLLMKKGRGSAEFSAPALTYISEKRMEAKLGRSIDSFADSQPIRWGRIMEHFAMRHISSNDYSMTSNDYRVHDALPWAGSADLVGENGNDSIGEIKSYQLKNFAAYSDCLMSRDVERLKKEFPQEYWQIVSNSILYNTALGEAISYMPYYEELEAISDELENTDFLEMKNFEAWKYRFIVESPMEELPYIEQGNYFRNITRFAFIVPNHDKAALVKRITDASELLK